VVRARLRRGSRRTTVEDITKLQAKFNWLEGASAGGSHRWQIGTDLGNIHVYYGDSHDWTGTSGSDINLMDATDDRFDDSNIGGTFYNTKQQILDKHAGLKVNNLALAVDSCWGQRRPEAEPRPRHRRDRGRRLHQERPAGSQDVHGRPDQQR
jgi:hypothetical protein